MKIGNIIFAFCLCMPPRLYLTIAFWAKTAIAKMKIVRVESIKEKPWEIKKACQVNRLDKKSLKFWPIFHLILKKVKK